MMIEAIHRCLGCGRNNMFVIYLVAMRRVTFLILFLFLLSVGTLYGLENDFEQFYEVELIFQDGEFEEALKRYDAFLRDFPDSALLPKVYYRKAYTLYQLHNYEKALELFTFLEKRYPNNQFSSSLPFYQGMCAFHLDRYKEAFAFFKHSPNDASNSYFTILTLLRLKKIEETQNAVYDFTTQFPDSERLQQIILHVADYLYQEGEYRKLIQFGTSSQIQTAATTSASQLLLYRAEAKFELNEKEKAAELYRQCLNASESVALVAYHRLYFMAHMENDRERMASLLIEIESRFSGKPEMIKEFWVQAGIESYEREELELAEYFLTRVWNIRKETDLPPIVPLTLADIYITSDGINRAKSLLTTYRNEHAADYPQIHVKRGNLALAENNLPQAMEDYRNALLLDDGSDTMTEAHYRLGYALYRSGNIQEALDAVNSGLTRSDTYLYRDLTNLKITLLEHLKKYDEAETVLTEYLDVYPNDVERTIDLEKVRIIQEDYSKVVTQSQIVDNRFPKLRENNPELFYLHAYFAGSAHYRLDRYETAISYFSRITEDLLTSDGLNTLFERETFRDVVPAACYYNGFALYRQKRYGDSLTVLKVCAEQFPNNAYFLESLFLQGLCYMERNEYEQAVAVFDDLITDSEKKIITQKAMFLQARSYHSLNKHRESAQTYDLLNKRFPNSSLADDALLGYAREIGKTGNIEEAVLTFRSFSREHPDSALRDDALFYLADLYFRNDRYQRAKEVYQEYERLFPQGEYGDAVLYYGGEAATETDDAAEAILLWEKLIRDYKTSSFRPEAIRKTAELYMKREDYEKSLELYLTLTDDYPNLSKYDEVERIISRLRFLITGSTEKEAELKSKIQQSGGTETDRGREAILALAEYYLLDQQIKEEEAYSLLQDILPSNDSAASIKANFLLGEYFSGKKEYENALSHFQSVFESYHDISLSVRREVTNDLFARSLYRAAEMERINGNTSSVRRLVSRLKRDFPRSSWAEESGRLLEGVQ